MFSREPSSGYPERYRRGSETNTKRNQNNGDYQKKQHQRRHQVIGRGGGSVRISPQRRLQAEHGTQHGELGAVRHRLPVSGRGRQGMYYSYPEIIEPQNFSLSWMNISNWN